MAETPEFPITADNPIDGLQRFIKVPLCCQETEYTCGVACVQSILACYGIIYRQDVLAEMLKTRPIYGTDYKNMINTMQMLGFQAFFNVSMDIDIVKEYIDKGTTPILLIQAWKEDKIDYEFDWRDSHYTIACGYNEHSILFMDPYTLGNYTFIPNFELIKRWHAVDQNGNRFNNSGLIVHHDKLSYSYQPNMIMHQG